MKLSYVTTYNALDIKNWSGTSHFLGKCLENQNVEVDYVDNLKQKTNILLEFKKLIYSQIFNKVFDLNRESYVAKNYSNQVQLKIKSNTDLIFSPSTIPIAFLKSNKPKVFYTDATFSAMIGFYKEFSDLCKETIEHGNYLEQLALDSVQLAIYSSNWAAKSAVENYNINPEKVKVVPFGANIEKPFEFIEIKEIINNRFHKSLQLLFIGVDWERKGGESAIRIAEYLNTMGINTTLHIVGISNLILSEKYPFIVNHGFISKSNFWGKKYLNELYEKCHFLLVPSIAECSAIVFCEANSFGIPVLTNDVGGSSTIIRNDINGKIFPLNTQIEIWCKYIYEVFLDYDRYKEFCLSSYGEFQTRLNWKVAGSSIVKLLKDI
jgi:glycosyltransferase involved in cell wall biosynthesis